MRTYQTNKQKGFSLVEIMVGLIIGLLVTLVVAGVFNVFEQRKRTTTGNSDAQTNGAIALFNVQRDVQLAGFALPVYGSDFTPFNCPLTTTFNHDNNAGTPDIGLSPVVITNGNGANGSDSVAVRYGNSMKGGIPINMEAGTSTNVVQVDTNIGCTFNDVALIITNTTCSMTRVGAAPGGVTAAGVSPVKITLASTTNVVEGNALSCLGVWNEVQYAVNANQLTRTGAVTAGVPNATAVPIVADIVNMQAQYGISASAVNNQVTQWVDATGVWANSATTPTIANRNRIKAVRIAIVARNGLLENTNVTTAAPVSWAGGPVIDLSADANWQRYRYRVYESIIPIRNIIWSRDVL